MVKSKIKLHPNYPKSSSSIAAPHCPTDFHLQKQKKRKKKSNTDEIKGRQLI